MIRITTNSSLRMYRSNLMKSTNSLNSAMTKLMTQRQFSSYASNPAAATRAFKIHSSLNATNAQYSNNDTVLHKYETAWSTLESVLDGYDGLVQDTGRVPALSGLNDTNLSTLNTQGQIIREGAEAIIQAMNGKYGNNFVFAGADSLNAPFAINDKGFVTYRGVEIDNPDTLDDIYLDDKGQPIKDANGKDMTNKEVLDMWNEEHQYVDIGLGFKLDGNGEVIPSTAFDSAISGIGIMGYGVDADGDPKNLASIMLRLADILRAMTMRLRHGMLEAAPKRRSCSRSWMPPAKPWGRSGPPWILRPISWTKTEPSWKTPTMPSMWSAATWRTSTRRTPFWSLYGPKPVTMPPFKWAPM